ncbi:MAG: HtaA domain-containing protein [Pseudomonadales bacterium]|nr:HtaA domain-containing protein [Pseudomonadales bacterium]
MSFSNLTWGVKASFRGYVEAAGGSVTLADGAKWSDDGAFVFNALPDGDLTISPDGSASGALRFEGSVTFEAHGGMLKSTITELALEAREDGLVLSSLDTAMNQRYDIARVALTEADEDGGFSFRSEITLDGMMLIADNYPPGTELDPMRLE